MKSNINESLNKLQTWINEECCICGRKYPSTILNIEAHIHHNNTKLECLDRKECRRRARKYDR